MIPNNAIIASGGFVRSAHPEYISEGIENYFLEKGLPQNLTIIFAAGQGDEEDRGVNHFAHVGLVKHVIGGHWKLAPKLVNFAFENKITAFNIPQGIVSKIYRAAASGDKFLISKVGLYTFVDPRLEGGKVNEITEEDINSIIKIDGEEYIKYKVPKINATILKGTTADYNGNISVEKEPFNADLLAMAQAAHNGGGVVLVQVENIVENIVRDLKISPHSIAIPGHIVDAVIKAPKEYCVQSYSTDYDPTFTGEVWSNGLKIENDLELIRKLIAARAVQELKKGMIINLGVGVPVGVSVLAGEKGIIGDLTFTVESGPSGGIAAVGDDFGSMHYPQSIIPQTNQFDFYHGGGLDITFLGIAQVDEKGDINVSRFGNFLAGCGGFIDISQNAAKCVFMGTFTAKGLEVRMKGDGEGKKIEIVKEGKIKKFKKEVGQITFSAKYASEVGHKTMYITERALFELRGGELMLTEVPPGIDIDKHIIPAMEFKPKISPDFRVNENYFKYLEFTR
ncbi:MAG: malonate decarboxylase subunit alpha [Promethearchaeota archaeon]